MNIGFFDSGKGAYFIAEYFRKKFPYYNISVFTDTKNVPYGNKSDTELLLLLEKNVRELFNDNAKLVIVACNTLSTTHLKNIQDSLVKNEFPDRKVLGVAIPTIEVIVKSSYKNFLVLATENTVRSEYFERKIKILDPEKKIVTHAIPNLATVIENGDFQQAQEIISQVIDSIKDSYEVIVLACTHYTILKDFLREKYPNTIIFSQDEIVADKLEEYLCLHSDIKMAVRKEN